MLEGRIKYLHSGCLRSFLISPDTACMRPQRCFSDWLKCKGEIPGYFPPAQEKGRMIGKGRSLRRTTVHYLSQASDAGRKQVGRIPFCTGCKAVQGKVPDF